VLRRLVGEKKAGWADSSGGRHLLQDPQRDIAEHCAKVGWVDALPMQDRLDAGIVQRCPAGVPNSCHAADGP